MSLLAAVLSSVRAAFPEKKAARANLEKLDHAATLAIQDFLVCLDYQA